MIEITKDEFFTKFFKTKEEAVNVFWFNLNYGTNNEACNDFDNFECPLEWFKAYFEGCGFEIAEYNGKYAIYSNFGLRDEDYSISEEVLSSIG